MTTVLKECLETFHGYFLSTTTLMGLLMQAPHYLGHIEEPVPVHQWCVHVPWCLQLKELRNLLERWLIRMKSPGLCDIINIKSNVEKLLCLYISLHEYWWIICIPYSFHALMNSMYIFIPARINRGTLRELLRACILFRKMPYFSLCAAISLTGGRRFKFIIRAYEPPPKGHRQLYCFISWFIYKMKIRHIYCSRRVASFSKQFKCKVHIRCPIFNCHPSETDSSLWKWRIEPINYIGNVVYAD